MRKLILILPGIILSVAILPGIVSGKVTDNQKYLKEYNVVWNTPSGDQHGSMPLGNGDIALNVWVGKNGDICFYIGKTDSWGDNGRLNKVGKVRVKTDPQLIFPGGTFKQELDLQTGTVRISSKGTLGNKPVDLELQLWVDANNPAIYLTQKSSVPLRMTASVELWRNRRDTIKTLEVSDLLKNQPDSIAQTVIEEPDNLIEKGGNLIGWFHHNRKSVGFDLTNRIQGLSEYFKEDPLLNRTFGAVITGSNSARISDSVLQTGYAKKGRLNLFVLTKHPSTPEEWLSAVKDLSNRIETVSIDKRRKSHEKWWIDFWKRSRIVASSSEAREDSSARLVTQGYTLQRFINASAGRGQYPIKFNGNLFTVPVGNSADADYRRWGPGYWWQNTRLPYLGMCAAGDYDLMQPFFKMYADEVYRLAKFRTRKYFGFEGAYYPECITFWGSVFLETYGWTPYEKREDRLQESQWHKWEWVSGPELVFMMLDYYDYTLDTRFLKEKIIPLANDILRFFDHFYKTGDDGKLVMSPSQSCETWWKCTNPMPELAGIYGITRRLTALPDNLVKGDDKQFWKSFLAKLPEIPLRDTPSGKALSPAEKFENKRNVENPELYAVFPFRLYGIGQPGIELAKNALEYRGDKGDFGWRQDDIFMAYLGLTDQAKNNLVNRAGKQDQKERFPAFWGPNYDWTPDQDHGGVLMKTLQSMLLQADPYSGKLYLFPAWPREWDVDFKLNAPYHTTLEGSLKNGKLTRLKVTPVEREKDVILSF